MVRRLQEGDTLLDAGCCFGYVLRQLAFDGAPQASLIGSDLRQEYLDLGFKLFGDRDRFGGRFVAGDMLAADDAALADAIDGKVDMVHAASFFHLFGWDDQVRLGVRMVRFFKPAATQAMIFGASGATPTRSTTPSTTGRRSAAITTTQRPCSSCGTRSASRPAQRGRPPRL